MDGKVLNVGEGWGEYSGLFLGGGEVGELDVLEIRSIQSIERPLQIRSLVVVENQFPKVGECEGVFRRSEWELVTDVKFLQ